MTFSVVIPTLNRPDVLEETLVSIRQQNIQPEQIIIIDQSSDDRTKVLCRRYCEVLYIHSTVKSISIARNTGIDVVDSDIIFFLDDDVELLPDYFKTILNTYGKDDAIAAVQGWVRKYHSFGRIANLIRKCFLFEHDSERMRLLRTFLGTNFEKRPSKIEEIGWCNGCGFSVRMDIAKKEKFEEHFFLYALAEDRDFSYRCSKYGKLLMNPDAEMIHKVVNISRLPSEKKTRMTYVHQMYLIAKNFGWSFKTSSAYWWNVFGRLLFKLIPALTFKRDKWDDFKNNWVSFVYVLKNKRKIIKKDIRDFNDWLHR